MRCGESSSFRLFYFVGAKSRLRGKNGPGGKGRAVAEKSQAAARGHTFNAGNTFK